MRLKLAGQKFGRWTVLSFHGVQRRYSSWLCRCDCGTERVVISRSLKNGTSKSCGCLHREIMTNVGKKHGCRKLPEYDVWNAMIQRCSNPNHANYHNYGLRGISVCDEWQKFENFLADMGRRPSNKHSIERIRNNEGYQPNNCKWATQVEQCNNTRHNRMLLVNGVARTISELARESGIQSCTIISRIEYGWSNEDAVLKPVNQAIWRNRKTP